MVGSHSGENSLSSVSELALHGSTVPLGNRTRVLPGDHPPYRTLDLAAAPVTTSLTLMLPNTLPQTAVLNSSVCRFGETTNGHLDPSTHVW